MFDAYTQFAIQCDGPLLVHERIAGHFSERSQMRTYALGSSGEPSASNVRVVNGAYVFDLHAEGCVLKDLQLGMPGRHNVENAIAASTVALRMGVGEDRLRAGLANFRGVARRFEVRVNSAKAVFIDDYAHHPKELDACIASVRELYPGRRITGVFQPHLFSRTRDLAPEFARSLSALDELILLEIYPAREEPIAGITSAWLLEQVPMANKVLATRDGLLDLLADRATDVLVTMGAGDIDRVLPDLERLINQRVEP
jgi:UDP-N-acetylmuramate--alanine ligase